MVTLYNNSGGIECMYKNKVIKMFTILNIFVNVNKQHEHMILKVPNVYTDRQKKYIASIAAVLIYNSIKIFFDNAF